MGQGGVRIGPLLLGLRCGNASRLSPNANLLHVKIMLPGQLIEGQQIIPNRQVDADSYFTSFTD